MPSTTETVTVSPAWQVLIPPSVRHRLGIQPGQRLHVILHDDRIELLPVRTASEFRGFLRGTPNDFQRETDRL